MSRSNYSDDCNGWSAIRWRGAVNAAIKGARGQKLLRELATAMDAMPEKRLIADQLANADGEFCALGVVGNARGIPREILLDVDPEDAGAIASLFDIAPALVKEIVYMNDDDDCRLRKPQTRWSCMREWVRDQINEAKP